VRGTAAPRPSVAQCSTGGNPAGTAYLETERPSSRSIRRHAPGPSEFATTHTTGPLGGRSFGYCQRAALSSQSPIRSAIPFEMHARVSVKNAARWRTSRRCRVSNGTSTNLEIRHASFQCAVVAAFEHPRPLSNRASEKTLRMLAACCSAHSRTRPHQRCVARDSCAMPFAAFLR